MKKLLFFTLFLGYLLPIHSQAISKDYNAVIGRVFKKINEIELFKNYQIDEGILISDSFEKKNSFYRISDGKNRVILYTKFIPSSNANMIIALQDIGKLEKNTKMIMSMCRMNLKDDGYIIALVKPLPWKPYFTNVIKAWRVDVKTNNFIDIPVKGIDCINDEFDNN